MEENAPAGVSDGAEDEDLAERRLSRFEYRLPHACEAAAVLRCKSRDGIFACGRADLNIC